MVTSLRFVRPLRATLASVATATLLLFSVGWFGLDAGTGRDGGTTITVTAAGDAGAELIVLRVDGEAVAEFQLGSSPNIFSRPQYADYQHQHDGEVSADQVTVAFVNDYFRNGVDHNVRVPSITLDGVEYPALGTVPASPLQPDTRCEPADHADQILACNGEVIFADTPAGETPTQPVPVTTSDTPDPTPEAPATPTTDLPAVPTTAAPEPPVTEPTSEPDPVDTAPVDTTPVTAAPADPPPPSEPQLAPLPEPSPAPGAPTGQFYVVGKDIIDPDGNIFYPIGANVAIKFTPYGYVFEGGNGGVNNHLSAVQAWNWNTIRATLICDNSSPSMDELINGIHPTIERFTNAGIVVMLECHDSTGDDPRLGSAKDLRIRQFWDEMARRYHDNPYVWFNVYNEPYASADTANWARLHEAYVNRIRSAGAENIIVADIPVWGQGIYLLSEQSFADDLNQMCNTVFGWHAYGAIANQQGSVADHERHIQRVQAKNMAVVIGEYGVAFPAEAGNAGPWAWNISGFEAMSQLGPKYGIGLLWWHATGDTSYFSLYALKTDRSGFWTAGNGGNLTPYGQKFWNVSQQVSHNRGAFTGDLAASNCASAR